MPFKINSENRSKKTSSEIINEYQNIFSELIKLKNIIIGTKKSNGKKSKILEYLLEPNLINADIIRNRICKIFDMENNEEIFAYLLNEIKNIFENNQSNKNSNEVQTKLKLYFYRILQELCFFISPSIIYYANSNNKNDLSFKYFNEYLLYDNDCSKDSFICYIYVFNLFDIVYETYGFDKKPLLSISSKKKLLTLIEVLQFQYIFPYDFFIKKILENNCDYCLYEIFSTYNLSLKELYNLSNYILTINSNFVQPSIIEKILKDKDILKNIDDKTKILLIEKIMINYSLNEKNTKAREKELLSYYSILSNNIELITIEYTINWTGLNNLYNNYNNKKLYDKCIHILTSINNTSIINKYIDNKLIVNLIDNVPFSKLGEISNIVKSNKNFINFTLQKYKNKNEYLKLIKMLKVGKGEYDSYFDELCINNFLQNKIYSCIENSFDILVDYGLINEKIYNKLICKLMKRIYSDNCVKKNENNNIIPLDEDECQNDENSNNMLKKTKEKNEEKKKSKKIVLSSLDKDKILYLYHLADLKNYNLSKNNQISFKRIFGDISFINYNLNYNAFIPKDKFGPVDPFCLTINKETQKVVFVDNIKSLQDNITFFSKSKYIGIDTEWRQNFELNMKEYTSIIQLANYSETCILIVDILKVKDDEKFISLFEKNFKNKIFIGFNFNSGDLERFNDNFQKFFKEAEVIDLIDIYQQIFLEKASSLKDMCQKILEKSLCKYEQCSNWENRPLKQAQLHYAAMDALVCVKLYKKLMNENNDDVIMY